jgi:GDP-fucose protein O-fucosyltransferase
VLEARATILVYSEAVTESHATRRYLAFETDLGGFNNILMHFEIMVALAWLTGRTLILPPRTPFYLLGSTPRSLLDFFDLDALKKHADVLTAEEFAPQSASHEEFHQLMRERGHSPGWNALEDVLVHPPNALTTRFALIERLCGRRPVGLTELEDECEILYFPTTKEHRMFSVFEAFFLFANPRNERRVRALVRDGVRYRPEILQLAERAIEAAPLAGQRFSAMHVRRGDFQYEETRICAEEMLHHTENLVPAGGNVYLATDETDSEFLRPFRERFQLVRFCDLPASVTAETPAHWAGILETLICAAAPERFVGTRLSTFSTRIATLRGYLSCGTGKHSGIDTALYYTQPPLAAATPEEMKPYGPPWQKHADEHGETARPWWKCVDREPMWGRAYRAVWAETGTD